MRPVVFLAITAFLSTGLAGAQLTRTNLHKLIPPGGSASDTIGFYPPAGPPSPASPQLMRIVKSVTVHIDTLNFPQDEALDVSLIHAGHIDTLVDGLRNSGENFAGTVFADTAAISIDSGIPPFSGEFAPAQPLSQFNGTDATGTWILRIINHSPDRTGVLEEWGVAIDILTVLTSAGNGAEGSPDGFRLFQNFPNPFNPTTMIRYSIPRRSRVWLTLFNTLGERIATISGGDQEPGTHQVLLDGSGLASGVYYYQLQAGGYAGTKSLVLLR